MTNSCEHRLGNKTNNMDLRQSYLLYMDEGKLFYIIRCSFCHQRKKTQVGLDARPEFAKKEMLRIVPQKFPWQIVDYAA